MGDIADMMLDGTMCQSCGEYMHGGEDGPGYPGDCAACRREEQNAKKKRQGVVDAIADSVLKRLIDNIEDEFDCAIDPQILIELRKQIGGVLRGLDITDDGFISHAGLQKTIDNNAEQAARAAHRAQKKAEKNHGK